MATDIHNSCLVCSQLILSTNHHLDKLEALFLLRILLDIPQDSQLLYTSQSVNLLSICEPCCSTVKTCKQIYTQIETQVNRFWELQSEILSKIENQPETYPHQITNQNCKWVDQCIQFVKNHNVVAFKYPFVYHDLHKLLNDSSGYSSFHPENCLDPLSIQIEDDLDDDVSEKYESSEEDDSSSPPQFYWNPNTRQFHCSLPTCTVSNKIKMFVERHFRREHLRRSKTRYSCSWPSCKKVFKKRANHQSHMDKHRGTPTLKCDKCGKLFYYPKGLKSHQSGDNCQPIHQQAASPSNIIDHYFESTNSNEHFVENVVLNQDLSGFGLFSDEYSVNTQQSVIEVTDTFIAEHDKLLFKEEVLFEDEDGDKNDEKLQSSENDGYCSVDFNDYALCRWPGCGKSLRDKTSLSDHMDRHRGTPKQKCEQCGQMFYSLSNLLNHQKREHESEEASYLNMKAHMDQHKGTPQWKCDYCPYECFRRRDWLHHVRKWHGLNLARERTDIIPRKTFKKDALTGKYTCPEQSCSKTYKHIRNITDHYKVDNLKVKEKTGFVCEYDECAGRLFGSRRYWEAHMNKHRKMPKFKCDQCNYVCYFKHNLVKHQRKKHGRKGDQLNMDIISSENGSNQIVLEATRSLEDFIDEDSCSSNSNEGLSSTLEQKTNQGHISGNRKVGNKVSSKEYNFRKDPITGTFHCLDSLCSKSYCSKQYVTQHYEREHLKIEKRRSFPCEWDGCGKVIGDKQSWQSHMDKHRGTPQYECKKCGAQFYWRKGYLKHIQTDHGEINKKTKKIKGGYGKYLNLDKSETY